MNELEKIAQAVFEKEVETDVKIAEIVHKSIMDSFMNDELFLMPSSTSRKRRMFSIAKFLFEKAEKM